MDALNNTPTAKELIEAEGYEDVLIFTNPSYDTAFMGVTECGRAVYDYEKMVAWLVEEDGITELEAIEWIDYNTIRALDYAEPKGPIILHRLRGGEA